MARVVVVAISAALCCNLLPFANSLAASATGPNVMNNSSPSIVQREKAVVVGGGPVGLASAIMLANRGYDVSVFEATASKEIRTFDPAIAYLYNVNVRGQIFTKMFPNIHKKLLERSVASSQTGFMLAPADVTKDITYPKIPAFGGVDESYWIARHDMTVLLWDAVEDHNTSTEQNNQIGKIEYEQGVSCIGVSPSNNDNRESSISVIVKNKSSGEEKTVTGKLVVGADGIRSRVRKCLQERSNLFAGWDYNAKKFEVKKFISPATGLKLKALQVPAGEYTIQDADGKEATTKNNDFVIVRGKKDTPLEYLSFGCLPVKDGVHIRPGNCVTRPNHVLWTMKTGEEVKHWFTNNYPRLDFDKMIPDKEWERFAKAEGLAFPPCQYSPGLQASSENDECGVVLLGDAAHAFSPDIGQGINSGLMDVVQLGEILESRATPSDGESGESKGSLGQALKKYESVQAPVTRGLIRIARFGSPYQYNQSLRKDRLGKKLHTANLAMRLLLNKITFGVFPKPMILMVNDISLSYRQVARRADLGTAALMTILAFSIFKLFVKSSIL